MQVSIFKNIYSSIPQESTLDKLVSTIKSSNHHHYYSCIYKIRIDKASANPCQLCIISADSDVYYNPSAKPLIYNESSTTIIP